MWPIVTMKLILKFERKHRAFEKKIEYESQTTKKTRMADLFIESYTEDHRYNDSVCYQRFCCKIEFAVIKKFYMDLSKA